MKKIVCLMILLISQVITLFSAVTHAQWKFSKDFDWLTNYTQSKILYSSQTNWVWNAWLQEFVLNILGTVVLPFIILWWIISAIIWAYDLLASDKDGDIKKWTNYIIYGTLWIIVATSAWFISWTFRTLIEKDLWVDVMPWNQNVLRLVQSVFDQVLLPFIKLWSYIAIATLFVILFVHMFRFLTNADDKVADNWRQIIISSIVWIIVIMWARLIIEAIFGKINQATTTIWWLWWPILWDMTLMAKIFAILWYFLGFVALILLVIFIYQWIQLLINPWDEKQIDKIKKTITYALMWVLLIGLAYFIVNFIIVRFV